MKHSIDLSLERVVFLVEVGGEVSIVLENEIGLSRLVLLDGRGHFLCLIRMTIEHADHGSPSVFQGFSQSQKLRKLLELTRQIFFGMEPAVFRFSRSEIALLSRHCKNLLL